MLQSVKHRESTYKGQHESVLAHGTTAAAEGEERDGAARPDHQVCADLEVVEADQDRDFPNAELRHEQPDSYTQHAQTQDLKRQMCMLKFNRF